MNLSPGDEQIPGQMDVWDCIAETEKERSAARTELGTPERGGAVDPQSTPRTRPVEHPAPCEPLTVQEIVAKRLKGTNA